MTKEKQYDDVEKLLDHMQLQGFSYRSFKRGESAPPLRVVRSADPPKDSPKPELAAETRCSAAAPVAPAVAAPAAAAPSASVAGTFERLMKGSIGASAPRLDLHLNLPGRTAQAEAEPAPARTLRDLFRRLEETAVVVSRKSSGGER